MIKDLDWFIGWRLKHLKLEKSKISHMAHKEEVKECMIRLLDGRIKELRAISELNRAGNLKEKGDYLKSKVAHLSKMKVFYVQMHQRK